MKQSYRLGRADLDSLFQSVKKRGYTIVAPTIREGAIVYDEIAGSDDLPRGWTDEQEAAHYRLKRRDDDAVFGYVVGPQSWKRFLFPTARRLWKASRAGGKIQVQNEPADQTRYAFVGVRACELQAIGIQDRVFLEGDYVDPHYEAVRDSALIIAVNCGQAASTCFCASMMSGPRAGEGFDLCLTEILEGEHRFFLEVGSEVGGEIVGELSLPLAEGVDHSATDAAVKHAETQISRRMDLADLKEMLYRNYESSHWKEVAERCLACANCTMVCPTCFCSSAEDVTDLTGDHAERWRRWDSCFSVEFSYLHGGSVRRSIYSRYRQWLTHKVGTWIDQFGTSGCVGCGRCITWCPVGIDLTEEVRLLREKEKGGNDGRTRD